MNIGRSLGNRMGRGKIGKTVGQYAWENRKKHGKIEKNVENRKMRRKIGGIVRNRKNHGK